MPSPVQINGECCCYPVLVIVLDKFSYCFKSYRYFFLSARHSISIIIPFSLVMAPVGNTANTVEGKKVMRVGLLTISDRVRCTVHLHASFLSHPPLFSDSSPNSTIYLGPVNTVLSFPLRLSASLRPPWGSMQTKVAQKWRKCWNLYLTHQNGHWSPWWCAPLLYLMTVVQHWLL